MADDEFHSFLQNQIKQKYYQEMLISMKKIIDMSILQLIVNHQTLFMIIICNFAGIIKNTTCLYCHHIISK